MKTIKINSLKEIPENFTGIIEYPDGSKVWYKKGKLHRINGPAVESSDGENHWWIEGEYYIDIDLKNLISSSICLGKNKDKYNIEWLKFLTDKAIEEFPIIPGMEEDSNFKSLFQLIK